jgi:hypothetical protein
MDTPLSRELSPVDYPLLRTFSCAPRFPWETEIDEIFKRLSFEKGPFPPELCVRIIEHPQSGVLMGAVAYYQHLLMRLPPPYDDLVPGAFIAALGVNGRYRTREDSPGDSGSRPCGFRVGPFLLKDVLWAIHDHWDGKIPTVAARIAPRNESCHRLVDAHGFRPLTNDHQSAYVTWARDADLPPDWSQDQR